MELFVYAVYFIGILAAFSALVVFLFARVPTNVLMCSEHAGRFAELGAAKADSLGKPGAGNRTQVFDMPKAHAA